MNYLDLFLGLSLIIGLYKGFKHGIIIELSTLFSFGLGIWAGIHFSDFFSAFLKSTFHWNSPYLGLLSFIFIFVAIVIGVYGLAKLIAYFARALTLGTINRLLGAAFGTLKFALIVSVILYMISALEKKIPIIPMACKEKSILYQPVSRLAPAIIPALKKSKINFF